jgi:cytidine deaminase
VIFEFGPNAIILYQGNSTVEELRASELLPRGFSF